MKLRNFILLSAMLLTALYFILCLSCSKEPTQEDSKFVLKEDFSETEFKGAIIGKWESVFELMAQENVKYLELTEKRIARITLKKESIEKEFVGNYRVNFLRPPQEDYVTFAEITIVTSKDSIILSRVNFGLHNGIPSDKIVLRIDESPYGVLDRMK